MEDRRGQDPPRLTQLRDTFSLHVQIKDLWNQKLKLGWAKYSVLTSNLENF